MTFPAIQAAYAEHGVATYPLTPGKKPAVSAYSRIGAPYSAQLALKFAEALAAGFVAGRRNRLTIVDIDSTDDRLVDEIQRKFGTTPLQVLTPSGGRHLYYRHNGEPRGIRALPDVDILGGGNCVAALSVVPRGRYQLERGTLDDLARLPPLREALATQEPPAGVPIGRRNDTLFKYCRSEAGHCDDVDALIDAARTWAAGRLEEGSDPVSDVEIIKTATSAWRYRGGRRGFMEHIVEGRKFAALVANIEAWALCAYLMAEQGPDAEFMIADGLGPARGWSRRFVPAARKALLDMDIIKCVRPPGNGVPALYRWSLPDGT